VRVWEQTLSQEVGLKLEDKFDSHYSYVLVAARRARQLQNGSQPLVASRSTKACRVAQEEIAAGKVKFMQPDPPDSEEPKEGLPASDFPGAI
jgi:DNA-directed RNA polymerase subunit omega